MTIDYLYLLFALWGGIGIAYVSATFSYLGPAGKALFHLRLISTDTAIAHSVAGCVCIPIMVSPIIEIPWASPGQAQQPLQCLLCMDRRYSH